MPSKKKPVKRKAKRDDSSLPPFLIDDSPRRTTSKRKKAVSTKKKITATKTKSKPRTTVRTKAVSKKPVAAKPKASKPKAKPRTDSSMPSFLSYEPGEVKYVERRERKPKKEKVRKERPVKRERPQKGQGHAPNTDDASTGKETAQERKRRGLFDTDDVRETREGFRNLSETIRKGIVSLRRGKDTSEAVKPAESGSTASKLADQPTVYDRTPKSKQPVDPWDEDEATITDLSDDPIYENCDKYASKLERERCKQRKRKAVAERYPDVYSGE